MCAVAEATGCGQLDEITEDEIDRMLGLPEAETADPGSVEDHPCVVGHQHQFTGGGGMTTLGIAGSDLPDLEEFRTDQPIDERRLPGTALAHQPECAPGAHQRSEIVETPTIHDARHDDRCRTGDCVDHLERIRRIANCVQLRQHDHRFGTAVDRQHQQSLEPAGLDGTIEPEHCCSCVDVARQYLFEVAFGRITATDRSPARQHPVDHETETFGFGEFDPITGDGGDLALRSLRVREDPTSAPTGHDIALAAVDTHDSATIGFGDDGAPPGRIDQGCSPLGKDDVGLHGTSVCLAGTIPRTDAFLRHGF